MPLAPTAEPRPLPTAIGERVRRFERRSLLENLANALGCSVVDQISIYRDQARYGAAGRDLGTLLVELPELLPSRQAAAR